MIKEFKIGDRVRIIKEPDMDHEIGDVGVVSELRELDCDPIHVIVDGEYGCYSPDELEFVDDVLRSEAISEDPSLDALINLLDRSEAAQLIQKRVAKDEKANLTRINKTIEQLKADITLIKRSRGEKAK